MIKPSYIEEFIVNEVLVFHASLKDLEDSDLKDIYDYLSWRINQSDEVFATIYDFEKYNVTPTSKRLATDLAAIFKDSKRSLITVVYNTSYFVRMLGTMIKPETKFTSSKEAALRLVSTMMDKTRG